MEWVVQVRQQKPCINHVEFRARILHLDIEHPELHIANSPFFCFPAREVQFRLINIHTDSPPAWANASGEFPGDVSTTTAKVEAVHPISDPQPFEKRRGARVHDAGKDFQPLPALDAPTNRVATTLWHDPGILQTQVGPFVLVSTLARRDGHRKGLA